MNKTVEKQNALKEVAKAKNEKKASLFTVKSAPALGQVVREQCCIR
ncbi:hypothetical protein P4U05_11605 [Bacillus paranthracis]|uniref:Uncharacterized protein n=1 Tax=Bacillus paranthracis TaxID=2026186 RepID=A0AAJ1K277_9BACI|nr:MULTISPECIES: hypothetical protein [Bacillus]ADY19592.1 hypothetical protein YBT020_01700 [Bacillus thuringiensis serovar finitimus YBT-020]MCU4923887.1 hypothetical protein [Bacillus cereus]MCW4574718.1 hypothetical protein [Bacillus pacificus]MDA1584738.1 hypothetical protein [Bacillus cereus group sp. TH230-1LC]MRC71168.1 hypothetical protein [Bacillus thuringiensis]